MTLCMDPTGLMSVLAYPDGTIGPFVRAFGPGWREN